MRYHLGEYSYGARFKTLRGIREFKKQVLRGLMHRTPDILYCHDADTLSLGMRLNRQRSIPVVFDMHDLHHTWVRMHAPRSLLRKLVSSIQERSMLKMLRDTDLIIVSSGKINSESKHPGFREYLSNRGFQSLVVENRTDTLSHRQPNDSKEWTVGYAGRIRETESFQFLLQTVESFDLENRPKVRIAGDGISSLNVKRMLSEFEKKGIRTEFSEGFQESELEGILEGIDVMFAMYSPERGNILQGALPVKMFDAAARGIPSVVNSGCLMGEIAQHERIGVAVEWMNTESLKNALTAARTMTVESHDMSAKQRNELVDSIQKILTRTVDEQPLL